MVKARPTAVNLRWAVERMSQLVEVMAGKGRERDSKEHSRESQK